MCAQLRTFELVEHGRVDRDLGEYRQIVSVTQEIGEVVEIPYHSAEPMVAHIKELELIAQILDAFSELVGPFVCRVVRQSRCVPVRYR